MLSRFLSKNKQDNYCDCRSCGFCDFKNNKDEILKILLSEHKDKPQLTDDEITIFRSVDKEYKYITRDRNDDLYIYQEKPKKLGIIWQTTEKCAAYFGTFNHLFSFIKWEDKEPWFIPDLLED